MLSTTPSFNNSSSSSSTTVVHSYAFHDTTSCRACSIRHNKTPSFRWDINTATQTTSLNLSKNERRIKIINSNSNPQTLQKQQEQQQKEQNKKKSTFRYLSTKTILFGILSIGITGATPNGKKNLIRLIVCLASYSSAKYTYDVFEKKYYDMNNKSEGAIYNTNGDYYTNKIHDDDHNDEFIEDEEKKTSINSNKKKRMTKIWELFHKLKERLKGKEDGVDDGNGIIFINGTNNNNNDYHDQSSSSSSSPIINNNTTPSPHTSSINTTTNTISNGKKWLQQSLTNLQQTEQQIFDIKQKEALDKQEAQKQKAKEWINETLRSTALAKAKADVMRREEAEARLKAQKWAESITRQSGIDL